MNPKLTADQRAALKNKPQGPVPVVDEKTQQVYFIVGKELNERAMRALREQEDIAAIQAGIEDMEAGRFVPLEEADADIRKSLGFPPRRA